jgi:hypothetical protein
MVVRCSLGFMGTLLISAHVSATEPAPNAPSNVAIPEVAPALEPAPAPPVTPPAAPPVPVRFLTSPDYELVIQGTGSAARAEPCGPSCSYNISPGSYQVHLMDSGEKKASFNVDVQGRSDVEVSPGSPFLRGLGMGIAIVGATAVAVGAFALYYDVVLSKRRTASAISTQASAIGGQIGSYPQ